MAFSVFRSVYGSRFAPFEGIPGPEPTFPLGNLRDVSPQRPWEVCADYARRFGGVTLLWLGGTPALVLNDPDLIGEVLVDRTDDFYKDAPVKALQPVITPKSLFISNHPEWQPKRAADPLTRVDQDGWLAALVEPLRNVILARLQRLTSRPGTAPVDLFDEMQRLTFDAFSQAFWGCVVPPDRYEWFQRMASTGSRRMSLPVLPTPPLDPRFYGAISRWYQSFESLVAAARKNPQPDATDLLNITLRHGTQMSDAALAETLATNFFGGVFSASSTLNTALHLLDKHPREKGTLVSALPSAGSTWDLAGLRQCRRLEFVLREAMRCYPAVPLYFRNSSPERRVKLGRWELPPNTQLWISNWWLHKFSDHWTNPDQFLPERWDQGVAEAHPYGCGRFFPFGRGPRMCVGMPFALFYLQLALATILAHFNVELDASSRYQTSFFFGVMMPKGLRARFSARDHR